jgi:hypothetical protein
MSSSGRLNCGRIVLLDIKFTGSRVLTVLDDRPKSIKTIHSIPTNKPVSTFNKTDKTECTGILCQRGTKADNSDGSYGALGDVRRCMGSYHDKGTGERWTVDERMKIGNGGFAEEEDSRGRLGMCGDGGMPRAAFDIGKGVKGEVRAENVVGSHG